MATYQIIYKIIRNILIWLFFISLNSCCAQKRNEKEPIFPQKNNIMHVEDNKKEFNYLNVSELVVLVNGLHCWKSDKDCQTLDGITTLYSYHTSNNDNAILIPYNFAEGEFINGQYNGLWKYYDVIGNIIKEEKWDNGKLIYRKELK